MKVKELAPIRGTEELNSELLFSFDELYLEDLKYYNDDIRVDGDAKLLIFTLN